MKLFANDREKGVEYEKKECFPYAADLFTFYFLDDSSLLVEYVNGNAPWPGFTWHKDDEYLYVTAPSAEELGEFNYQTWESVGREKWPVDAKSRVQGDIAWAEPILQDEDAAWKRDIYRIACQYNPDMRSGEVIFYGASNFNYWRTMEEDLRHYAVQNHAFGGSTDRDLLHWAPYMLYPYQPRIIFSGNYSRTARPLQPRYFPPCAYAANRPCKYLHLKGRRILVPIQLNDPDSP